MILVVWILRRYQYYDDDDDVDDDDAYDNNDDIDIFLIQLISFKKHFYFHINECYDYLIIKFNINVYMSYNSL